MAPFGWSSVLNRIYILRDSRAYLVPQGLIYSSYGEHRAWRSNPIANQNFSEMLVHLLAGVYAGVESYIGRRSQTESQIGTRSFRTG
jgi:hypothetical protein